MFLRTKTKHILDWKRIAIDRYIYINIAERKVFSAGTILALVFGWLNKNLRVASDPQMAADRANHMINTYKANQASDIWNFDHNNIRYKIC